MSRQFTIENTRKRSALAHESVTIVLSSGKVWALSRDLTKSVSPHYRQLGEVVSDSQGKLIALWSDSLQARLVASWLASKGYRVLGATVSEGYTLRDYNPKRDNYDWALTSPESIRKALGEPVTIRRRSLDLGVAGKSTPKVSSVEDMRARILARQAKV